ncbi:methylase involved in ubiquinone/menaquinone biosynthesis [Mycobacterium tuberculosis]|nr:methylase involved in ubiquinone/menaquinone biosynthesis [Mycobacterium tuberculosis]
MAGSDETYRSYETYFETKKYAQRYPLPNRLALARILRALSPGATLIDIGAGHGRYSIALAEKGYTVVAVERSDAAREQLTETALRRGLSDKLHCFKELEDVDPKLAEKSRLSLLLFGVLSHMAFKEREIALKTIQSMMDEKVNVIGSVPCTFRRYKSERVNAKIDDFGDAPRFFYTHHLDGATHEFAYTAFSPQQLRAEFALHGWEPVQMKTESVLSERKVARNRIIGAGDAMFSRMTPCRFSHAIFFHIRPADDAPPN